MNRVELGSARIDGVIASRRIVILEAFLAEVRLLFGFASSRVAPRDIVQPADACIAALVRAFGSDAPDSERAVVGAAYAAQRIALGYDLRALLVEIGILRSTIIEVITVHTRTPPGDAVERIAEFFHDVTVAAAVRHASSPVRASMPSRPPLYVSRDTR